MGFERDTMVSLGRRLLLIFLAAAAPALFAANGNLLHGIGAVNSAMGGAGTALPNDVFGALSLNPALLTSIGGDRAEFSLELLQTTSRVAGSVGTFSGETKSAGDPDMIPALGFVHHWADGRTAIGFGALGVAGFSTDYPADPRNPVLAPQPNGFGRFYTSYQIARMPIAVSRDFGRVSAGVALIAAVSRLGVSPAGFAAPDCSGPKGPCFYPTADNDSALGSAAQIGILYRISDSTSFGASYSTATKFQQFSFRSTAADPAMPNYGAPRTFKFRLDSPQFFVVGLSSHPTPMLAVAVDAKWIGFSGASGLGGKGVDPATGRVLGLGWRDAWVLAAGAEAKINDWLVVRGGVNHGTSPIPAEQSFFNVGTPGVFRDHITTGATVRVSKSIDVNLGYYHVLKTHETGPILSSAGPVPGSSVTNTVSLDGLLIGFNFRM